MKILNNFFIAMKKPVLSDKGKANIVTLLMIISIILGNLAYIQNDVWYMIAMHITIIITALVDSSRKK